MFKKTLVNKISKDKLLLRRCELLSRLSLNKNRPNPQVGSILFDKKILSEGWHEKYGENHAERNCLLKFNEAPSSNCILYVTLEPCNHHGNTPPCTKLIREKKIQQIKISRIDPNPLMSGKSILELEKFDIKINHINVNNISYDEIFETNITKERPYVSLKFAQTKNHFLDSEFRQQKISNQITDRFTHKLRHDMDAILVGHTTLINDQPRLTNRHFYGRNPVKIILSSSNLDQDKINKILGQQNKSFVINQHIEKTVGNIRYISFSKESQLSEILSKLYTEHKITSILVEGGAQTIHGFLKEDLWDQAFVITNNNLSSLTGTKAPIIEGNEVDRLTIRNNSIIQYKPYTI